MNIVVRMLEEKSDDIPEGVPWVGDFLKMRETLRS
jgi:hypothetical protein